MSETEVKTLEDARRHGREQANQRAQDDHVQRRWEVVRRIMWMVLLAGAFLAYYLLDKMSEAVSLLK